MKVAQARQFINCWFPKNKVIITRSDDSWFTLLDPDMDHACRVKISKDRQRTERELFFAMGQLAGWAWGFGIAKEIMSGMCEREQQQQKELIGITRRD